MADSFSGTIRDHAVAFGWGVAEATAFFVVPDVWTSRVALRHPRRAFASTLSATAGAIVGGVILHRWASRTPASESARVMARIPAIDAAMVEEVDAQVAGSGYRAMLVGPTRGVPYKLYARSAGTRGLPLGGLIAWTGPARIVRFALVTAMVGAMAEGSRRAGLNRPGRGLARVLGTPERAEQAVHAVGWTVFYAWYFHAVRTGKLGRLHSRSGSGDTP